ncbi:MAG: hypothetical protein R2828_07920 [Saprospiraceae bacterium]
MDNKFLDQIAKSFNTEMPAANSLDEYLDKVIKVVKPWSEDLRETNFYLGKHWIEVRDDENFHSVVMHIFNEEGEYLRVVDGDLSSGEWRHLGNKLVFEDEVFELAFMDPEFFILVKHGNPNKFKRKYFVLVAEKLANKFTWRELVELLFNKYRDNNNFYLTVSVIVILIIAIIFLLS